MSKSVTEMTSEIVQEVVKARGMAIAGIDGISTQSEFIEKTLSDSAISSLYDKIYETIANKYR